MTEAPLQQHAKLSPSGSSRWLTCPGSVHLSEGILETGGSSDAASRGTAMHEISEKSLRSNIKPENWLGQTVNGHVITQDMIDQVNYYAAVINAAKQTIDENKGLLKLEEKVTLDAIIPDCWGTADALVMINKKMTVIDLKTGRIPVAAENNTQLLIYALGAYAAYDWAFNFQEITMVIVQPSLNTVDSWTISVRELKAFAKVVKKAYLRIQKEPTTYVPTEAGCRWCRAKPNCPALQEKADAAAAVDFDNVSSLEKDLSYWLTQVPLLKQFIAAVEAMAKDNLVAGISVDGFKLVNGRATRKWTDDVEALKFLKGLGYSEEMLMTAPAIKSVAQMEKALKAEAVDFTAFVVKEIGEPSVAPESDKRKEISTQTAAASEFMA